MLQPYVDWISTFSCTEGNELIPQIAKEFGLGTMVGACIDSDHQHNDIELNNAVEVAAAGYADLLAVGNEVLLRGEMFEDELIDYIKRARKSMQNVPVGYVDTYFDFVIHPHVSDACDVIFANPYPFWEGYPAEHALVYVKNIFRRALNAAKGRQLLVGPVGQNFGTAEHDAVPSYENAIRYFVNTFQLAEEEKVEIFYFSAFDGAWKVADEEDVGVYWGLWDKDRKLKYA